MADGTLSAVSPVGDPAGAIKYLEELLAIVSEMDAMYWGDPEGYFRRRDWKELDARVEGLLPGALRIAQQIDSTAAQKMEHPPGAYTFQWDNLRQGVVRAVGALRTQPAVDAILAPAGPKIAAGELHPVVWQAAARLWDQGNRRLALQTAATMIDAHLQAKLNVVKPSGYDLVTQAFKPDAKPGSKVLRFAQYSQGSDDWTSAHQGAMHFGQGCMMAIRNLATHHAVEPSPELALEQMAALSVLCRWIDDAEVVTV